MPGVYRDLIQVRNDPVNTERLITELTLIYHIIDSSGSRVFPVIEYQIGRIHVSVLSVRRSHFVPGGAGLRDHLYGQGVLISREDLIVSSGTVTQIQRALPGFRSGKIRIDTIDFRTAVISRCTLRSYTAH